MTQDKELAEMRRQWRVQCQNSEYWREKYNGACRAINVLLVMLTTAVVAMMLEASR